MKDLIAPSDLVALAWDNVVRNLRGYAEFAVWIAALSLLQVIITTFLRDSVADKSTYTMLYFLATLPTSAVVMVLFGGMIDYTASAVRDRHTDLRSSLSVGLHHFFSLIWIAILLSLVTIGGFLLFVIPMFIFYVWFKFSYYYLFIDGIKGTGALRSSKELVAGRWWQVLLRLVVPTVFFGVAIYFVTMLIYLVIGSVLGDPRMFFGSPASVWNVSTSQIVVTMIVPQVIGTFGAALVLSADLILFFDLRKKI